MERALCSSDVVNSIAEPTPSSLYFYEPEIPSCSLLFHSVGFELVLLKISDMTKAWPTFGVIQWAEENHRRTFRWNLLDTTEDRLYTHSLSNDATLYFCKRTDKQGENLTDRKPNSKTRFVVLSWIFIWCYGIWAQRWYSILICSAKWIRLLSVVIFPINTKWSVLRSWDLGQGRWRSGNIYWRIVYLWCSAVNSTLLY